MRFNGAKYLPGTGLRRKYLVDEVDVVFELCYSI
jgi:hypothetical protein